MAEGSEKQESLFYPIAHRLARLLQNAAVSLGFRRLLCREQPVYVVREFAQPHSTGIRHALSASWDRGHLDCASDDQGRRDDRFRLCFQWIHHGLPLCLTREDFRRTDAIT